MIDAENRANPRFPAKNEAPVMEAIRKQLQIAKEKTKDDLKGISSGACGGDILFHELCLEAGIPSEIYLPLPVSEFRKISVSFAGAEWEARFDALIKKLPVHMLPGTGVMNKDENVWERVNLWMLAIALENGGKNMTLLALWDGKGGDGSGGTEHMVNMAKEKGAEVNIIQINKL